MRSRTSRPWREELKDLFAMHKGERRGFTLLLVFCLLAAGWVTYEQWLRPIHVQDAEKLEVAWRELETEKDVPTSDHQRSKDVTLFTFDPNGLATEQWVMLGLTERQAGAIHRYEERGGRFRTKRDLARMRVIDPELFAQWEPYIQLPDSMLKRDHGAYAERSGPQWEKNDRKKDRSDPAEARSSRPKLEVNAADSAQLVDLPGIGPSFAKGILKFRDRLGGFHDLDQLAEVYVLRDKPDAIERLKTLLVVDSLAMRRYGLNTFTAEELGPHPYAGWKLAKALVAFRKQHGGFKTVTDIKGCVLVTDSIYRKLAPYLEASP